MSAAKEFCACGTEAVVNLGVPLCAAHGAVVLARRAADERIKLPAPLHEELVTLRKRVPELEASLAAVDPDRQVALAQAQAAKQRAAERDVTVAEQAAAIAGMQQQVATLLGYEVARDGQPEWPDLMAEVGALRDAYIESAAMRAAGGQQDQAGPAARARVHQRFVQRVGVGLKPRAA